MSTDREVTRIVRSWLEEGATALPDRVLDAVLDQVPATPQRRALWPARRLPILNNPIRIAIAIAAVLVVAVIGFTLLPRDQGIGKPGPTPSPTASPIALGASHVNVVMSPGTYHVADPFSIPLTITVPSDWIPKAMAAGDVEFRRSTPDNGAAWVVVDIVDGLYPDPCHIEDGPVRPPATSTVDGLVEALTNLTGFTAGPVTDVQMDGHQAKTFVLTNAIDTDTAGCSRSMLWLWHFQGGGDAGTNGGATEHIWVVDVDGTPVVIDGETFPQTPAGDVVEMETMVASIRFESAPASPSPSP